MIFLETSFIINYYVTKVQNHEKAKEIFKEIEKNLNVLVK